MEYMIEFGFIPLYFTGAKLILSLLICQTDKNQSDWNKKLELGKVENCPLLNFVPPGQP